MRWFEQDFDEKTAKEFLVECHRFTEEFILNYAKEMIISWPLTNILPSTIFDFNPRGAIVHTSDTISVWNELHLCTKHVFGTHFVVMSGNHENRSTMSRFPLLAEIPADILMLYPLDALIPHSGYISPFTWGIELRNAGRLRPYPRGLTPQPILPSEESEQNFYVNPNIRYDTYWRQRLWCYPFDGQSYQWENYLYEIPTQNQIIAMLVLLRILDFFAEGLDRRLILPSNCISGSIPKLPLVVWNTIRDMTAERNIINPEHEWLNYLPTRGRSYELYDIEEEDEAMHGEQMEISRWRGERDDGQLAALRGDRKFLLAGGYKRNLEPLGYDSSDPDFALHMWAISQGLTIAKSAEIYSKANRCFYSS